MLEGDDQGARGPPAAEARRAGTGGQARPGTMGGRGCPLALTPALGPSSFSLGLPEESCWRRPHPPVRPPAPRPPPRALVRARRRLRFLRRRRLAPPSSGPALRSARSPRPSLRPLSHSTHRLGSAPSSAPTSTSVPGPPAQQAWPARRPRLRLGPAGGGWPIPGGPRRPPHAFTAPRSRVQASPAPAPRGRQTPSAPPPRRRPPHLGLGSAGPSEKAGRGPWGAALIGCRRGREAEGRGRRRGGAEDAGGREGAPEPRGERGGWGSVPGRGRSGRGGGGRAE